MLEYTLNNGVMMRLIDITGKRFSKLIAIECAYKTKKVHFWRFKCDCGNESIIRKADVMHGKTQSCGCFLREVRTTYNCHNERLYKIWRGMLKRCYQVHTKDYQRYGIKGIKVCDEWKSDYIAFKGWSLSSGYTDELSIDRIDNNGNYESSNCRWTTYKIQNRNRGVYNTVIVFNGEEKTIAEWAEIANLPSRLLRQRLSKGWHVNKIFMPSYKQGLYDRKQDHRSA